VSYCIKWRENGISKYFSGEIAYSALLLIENKADKAISPNKKKKNW